MCLEWDFQLSIVMAFPQGSDWKKEVESMMFFNKKDDSALETQEGAAYSEKLAELAEQGPIFGNDDENETNIIEF